MACLLSAGHVTSTSASRCSKLPSSTKSGWPRQNEKKPSEVGNSGGRVQGRVRLGWRGTCVGVREGAEQMHEGHLFLAKGPCPVPKAASVAGRNEWGHRYMLLTILCDLHVKQGKCLHLLICK